MTTSNQGSIIIPDGSNATVNSLNFVNNTNLSGIAFGGTISTQSTYLTDELETEIMSILNGMGNSFELNEAPSYLQSFLIIYYDNNGHLPQTWSDLILGIRAYVQGNEANPIPAASTIQPPQLQDPTFTGSYGSGANASQSTIYSDLTTAVSNYLNLTNPAEYPATNPQAGSIFQTIMGQFLSTFVPNGNPQDPTYNFVNDLSTQFGQYLTQFASINAPSIDPNVMLTYQQVYDAFLAPGQSPSGFATAFQTFFNANGGGTGTFDASKLFDQWTAQAVTNYSEALVGTPSLTTSTVGATSTKARVLNDVFNILILLIEALQSVAAAQSNRLTFLSQWQQAYTGLQANVPYIVANDPQLGYRALSNNSTALGDFNNYNSGLIQTIQARNSIVSDYAKGLETSINQSNDAASQEVDIATAFLQQLSTILASIFR